MDVWGAGLLWGLLVIGNAGHADADVDADVEETVLGPISGPAELVAGSRSGFVTTAGGEVRVYTPRGDLVRRAWAVGGRVPPASRRSAPDLEGLSSEGPAAMARGDGEAGPTDEWTGDAGEDSALDPALLSTALSLSPGSATESAPPGAEADPRGVLGGDREKPTRPPGRRRPEIAGQVVGQIAGQVVGQVVGDDGLIAPGRVVRIAVGDRHAFVGRSDGLWRVSLLDGALGRCPGLDQGIDGVAASSDGRHVAVAMAGRIHQSSDGGQDFAATTEWSGALGGLAVSALGDVLYWDDAGPRVLFADGAPAIAMRDRLPGRVQEVVACGDRFVIADAWGRLFEVNPRPAGRSRAVRQVGELPAGTVHVLCLPSGDRVAYGSGLWRSADGGTRWTRLANAVAVATPVRAMSAAGARVWAATAAGTWAMPASALVAPSAVALPRHPRLAAAGGDLAPPAACRLAVPPPWASSVGGARTSMAPLARPLLPRISVAVSVARDRARVSLVAFVTATFTLGARAWLEPTMREHAATAAGRRDLDARIIARAAAAVRGDDPIAAEERRTIACLEASKP